MDCSGPSSVANCGLAVDGKSCAQHVRGPNRAASPRAAGAPQCPMPDCQFTNASRLARPPRPSNAERAPAPSGKASATVSRRALSMRSAPNRPASSSVCRSSVRPTHREPEGSGTRSASAAGGARRRAASQPPANEQAQSAAPVPGARSELIEIPTPDGAVIPALLYAPAEDTQITGFVVVAPGSNGGMGPGVEERIAGLPLEKSDSRDAYGSMYRRLGREFTTGLTYDWNNKQVMDEQPRSSRSRSKAAVGGGMVAVLHITWRQCRGGKRWPGPLLRRVDSLRSAAADITVAAKYMRSMFPNINAPLVLVGMSFGGPAAWAAAYSLVREGQPPAGVVALAASGRGGTAFQRDQLDTWRCISGCVGAGIPALFLHGTADKNVDLSVAQYFFHCSCNSGSLEPVGSQMPKDAEEFVAATLVVLLHSVHMFSNARDKAYATLKDWLVVCIAHAVAGAQPLKQSRALVLRRQGTEIYGCPTVRREALLPESVKGYSEKEAELPQLARNSESDIDASEADSYGTDSEDLEADL